MALKELVPWRWGGLRRWEEEERPFQAFRREMETDLPKSATLALSFGESYATGIR